MQVLFLSMRIAILSDPDNFHTRKWARALIAAGAEVQVFSYDECSHSDFPSVQLPLPKACRGRLSYRAYLKGGGTLRAALIEAKIDVAVALNVTPFGVWAMKSGFQPWVSVAMGADILEFLPPSMAPKGLDARSWDNIEGHKRGWAAWKSALTRPLFRRFVKKALHSAKFITADNQPLVDGIIHGFDIPASKVALNRWGLEPEKFNADLYPYSGIKAKLGIPATHSVVLSPRGLKAFYQADVIAEAYSLLVESGKEDCTLVMLGAGYPISAKTKEWIERARKLGANLVVVEQLLDDQEMAQLWMATDVFISAPLYDGYSSSVAEGRFVGAIPVVNAIPGNTEVITHGVNGWICEPFTAEQLAHDLNQILKDLPELKRRFADKNRKWILENGLIKPNSKEFIALLIRFIQP